MAEISTHLVVGIRSMFRKKLEASEKIRSLSAVVASGGGTYVEAQEYAEEVGAALSSAILAYITPESIGAMDKELADQILKPALKAGFTDVEAISRAVQNNLNKAAGIGLKAVGAKQNADRVDGLCKAVSAYEETEAALWVFGEPILTYMRTIPTDVLRENIRFQGRAGLHPQIIRTAEHKCCKFCDSLDGVFDYPVEDTDVFRRHDRCRCTVDYSPGDGRFQNVHTKNWE